MKTPAFALSAVLVASVGLPAAHARQGQEAAPGAMPRPGINVQVLGEPGVNLDPYLQRLVADVRAHWQPPMGSAPAEVDISLAIGPDGTMDSMHLDTHAKDVVMNKAAWAALTGTTYAPLPWGMRESKLRLRLRFFAG